MEEPSGSAPMTRALVPHDEAPPRGAGWTGGMVRGVLVLLVGLSLGIVNQTAREVSSGLRVPALIAALILVAQALVIFDGERGPAAARTVVVLPEDLPERPESRPGQAITRAATSRVVGVVRENVAVTKDNKVILWLGIGLAVWLGMATLANPTAPTILVSLALLAAFLLFADSWKNLRKRR